MLTTVFVLAGIVAFLVGVKELLGIRSIPNDRVGVIEKLWSRKGSVTNGHVIATGGEAGFQADIRRGGLHFGLFRWQYRIHKLPLVAIAQGKIGYVYARDGSALDPSQTLAKVTPSNNFQDANMFLADGQRGRQRAILREGVYAINLALFTVITEDTRYTLGRDREESIRVATWQNDLKEVDGFSPLVIGGDSANDNIGVVTVQDGPSLPPGDIIASATSTEHNNYQDPEAFLIGGGRRGKQYMPLTDGTFFINRWFASVEKIPKTIVKIGEVGVVISYVGEKGTDISGESFRHGERVANGQKGVWNEPLPPGKYAFNTYAGQVVMVPTTNFVLHWITGKSENHKFDETLRSIDLVTQDAYEPNLPLSLVVHIDYKKAPSVVQRFGDVKRLITQTIDPMLSAYFRDSAQNMAMLDLLQHREELQDKAHTVLAKRFSDFDIECVDVLVGKPECGAADGKIENLLEQLRLRQLSREQIETFQQQRAAAEEQKKLTEARAIADQQKELTVSKIAISIAENAGNAELARAEMRRKQTIVEADASLERARKQAEETVVAATAVSKQRTLEGEGESAKVLAIGQAEATVQRLKVESFGDPKFYAMYLVAGELANSTQPLVPTSIISSGEGGTNGLLTTLLNMIVSEKAKAAVPALPASAN